MSKPNFWNQDHELSAVADSLYDALVPDSGHCDTIQGELIRASNKIAYDWYNNGWGCNNWSGAVQYIQRYFTVLPIQPLPIDYQRLSRALNIVAEYSHGEPVRMDDEKINDLVTTIHEIIVATLVKNPVGIKNPCSMYSLTEADYQHEPLWGDDEEEEY